MDEREGVESEEEAYFARTRSMPARPILRTSILGPYEKRTFSNLLISIVRLGMDGLGRGLTKWWQGESNRSRLLEGLRSKKMPGTTMTFSMRQASKNLRPSEILSGSPETCGYVSIVD